MRSLILSINDLYQQNVKTPSNIYKELEVINRYAQGCKHITEFGFGSGRSASALLAAKPEVFITYDIRPPNEPALQIEALAENDDITFIYKTTDTSKAEIEPTDLLFIDTYHTGDQLKAELKNAPKVRKFIMMHDIVIYGLRGEDDKTPGLKDVLIDFLRHNSEWGLIEVIKERNGLAIIGRKPANKINPVRLLI
jgi:hypothetical protein